MQSHNGYIKQGWYIKANQAWSFKYICKGWLLGLGTQWLPWHICESDGKNIMAICKSDGNKYYVDLQERWKGLWPSVRAMGISITLICKSDEKDKY